MKKIISILTVLVLIFTIDIDAYALTSSKYRDMMDTYRNFVDKVTITPADLLDFMDTALTSVGINIKPYSSGGHAFDNAKDSIHSIDPNIDSNSTIEEVKNWIDQHIEITDTDVSVDNDFRTYITNYYNNYDTVYGSGWAYSMPLSDSIGGYVYSDVVDAFHVLCSDLQIDERNNVFILDNSSSLRLYILSKNEIYFVDDGVDNFGGHRFSLYSKDGLDLHPTGYKINIVNGVKTFVQVNSTYNWVSGGIKIYAGRDDLPSYSITQSHSAYFYISYDFIYRVIYYKDNYSGIDANNTNILNQYKNNSIWNDFSSSSGDWTFSPSNTNTVTYGDTVEYINNYYEDNDYYPDQSVVNQWIGDQNIINNGDDNNSGGGGSGSDDNDDGSIFDWLKNLGKVLGDLIKGLGEFITEIISGLVSALNDLLSSLSGLINDTLGSLTNIFSGIIDFVYSGLPDSIKGIMMLALTVSLLITVIQLIRR